MGVTRILAERDAMDVQRLLEMRPIDNISIASRIRSAGLGRTQLGNDLIGYWDDWGRLTSFVSDGYSLHPVNATPEALDAFTTYLEHRHCGSIVGVRDEVIGLWQRLCRTNFTQWAAPREVRDHQLVMAIGRDPQWWHGPGVEQATTRHLDSYLEASVAMYTEEIGVAPMSPQGSYRNHVASLIMRGQSWCWIKGGRVVFKADVVATSGPVCQVGGVWLAPELRGRGLSRPLMAAVVRECRLKYPTVTLYVNSYNTAAVRCYLAVGFTQVSECATVLY